MAAMAYNVGSASYNNKHIPSIMEKNNNDSVNNNNSHTYGTGRRRWSRCLFKLGKDRL